MEWDHMIQSFGAKVRTSLLFKEQWKVLDHFKSRTDNRTVFQKIPLVPGSLSEGEVEDSQANR